jgi:hypothetical protein
VCYILIYSVYGNESMTSLWAGYIAIFLQVYLIPFKIMFMSNMIRNIHWWNIQGSKKGKLCPIKRI